MRPRGGGARVRSGRCDRGGAKKHGFRSYESPARLRWIVSAMRAGPISILIRRRRAGSKVRGIITLSEAWGRGAAGSASDWQSEGQGFESPRLHHCSRWPTGPVTTELSHRAPEQVSSSKSPILRARWSRRITAVSQISGNSRPACSFGGLPSAHLDSASTNGGRDRCL